MQPTHEPPAVVVDGTDPVAYHLFAAADYLDQFGWIRKRVYSDAIHATPAACVMGALFMVIAGRPVMACADLSTDQADIYRHTTVTLARYLFGRHFDPVTLLDDIADWNDIHADDTDTVTTALRAAAEQHTDNHTGGAR